MSDVIKIKAHCMVNRIKKAVVIVLENGPDIPMLKKQGFVIEDTKEISFTIKPAS